MNIKYINKEKISSLKKFIIIPIIVGTLTLSACGYDNSYDHDYNSNDYNNSATQESASYPVEFNFSNFNTNDEQDAITIFDEEGNVYDVKFISSDGSRMVNIPVSKYTVSSKKLGKVRIDLEEGEKAIVSVDYLEKTINVNIEKTKSK